MAILMQDGCDLHGTDEAKATDYGWFFYGGPNVLATGGRFGGGCFQIRYSTEGLRWSFVETSVTTIFVNTAFYYPAVSAQTTYGFIQLRNNTDVLMGKVKINDSDQVEIYDADDALQATSTEVTGSGVWQNMQIKAVAHATTGSIEVWVDGVQFAIATGIDTMPASGNQYFQQVIFGTVNAGYAYRDDLVIWDNSGTGFNDWTAGKDLVIETNRCNAVGNLSQFTKSAGANNYENVDETPDHDVDTTYNYSSTSGQADRIGTDDLSVTPDTIYNVRTRVVARKTDAGAATLKVGVYSSTTEDLSAAQGLSTDYEFFHHDNEINPADSAAWEKADIDALQVQYEVV